METSANESGDWFVPCLDQNEELVPSAEDLDQMYQQLEAGELIELNWKCPGRRLPTPEGAPDTETPNEANTET